MYRRQAAEDRADRGQCEFYAIRLPKAEETRELKEHVKGKRKKLNGLERKT